MSKATNVVSSRPVDTTSVRIARFTHRGFRGFLLETKPGMLATVQVSMDPKATDPINASAVTEPKQNQYVRTSLQFVGNAVGIQRIEVSNGMVLVTTTTGNEQAMNGEGSILRKTIEALVEWLRANDQAAVELHLPAYADVGGMIALKVHTHNYIAAENGGEIQGNFFALDLGNPPCGIEAARVRQAARFVDFDGVTCLIATDKIGQLYLLDVDDVQRSMILAERYSEQIPQSGDAPLITKPTLMLRGKPVADVVGVDYFSRCLTIRDQQFLALQGVSGESYGLDILELFQNGRAVRIEIKPATQSTGRILGQTQFSEGNAPWTQLQDDGVNGVVHFCPEAPQLVASGSQS